MEMDGGQPGLLNEEVIDDFAEEMVEYIRDLRRRDARLARDLTWILGAMINRGLRSRLPSLRQISRRVQAVQQTWYMALQHHMNVHSNRLFEFSVLGLKVK